jgi:hypothetical protein
MDYNEQLINGLAIFYICIEMVCNLNRVNRIESIESWILMEYVKYFMEHKLALLWN